jgi:hypothetical protein
MAHCGFVNWQLMIDWRFCQLGLGDYSEIGNFIEDLVTVAVGTPRARHEGHEPAGREPENPDGGVCAADYRAGRQDTVEAGGRRISGQLIDAATSIANQF